MPAAKLVSCDFIPAQICIDAKFHRLFAGAVDDAHGIRCIGRDESARALRIAERGGEADDARLTARRGGETREQAAQMHSAHAGKERVQFVDNDEVQLGVDASKVDAVVNEVGFE